MFAGAYRGGDEPTRAPGVRLAQNVADTTQAGVQASTANVDMRRRVPRTSAGWAGSYQFEGGAELHAGRCRVLDISVMGAGVEVFDSAPEQPVGRQLAIDVQAWAGGSVAIGLVGVVRNTRSGNEGGLRLGMEFVGLSDTERSILDALEMMQVFW